MVRDIERHVGIAGTRQAIVRIVGRGAHDPLRVGMREAITGRIVGVGAGAGIRALQLGAIAEPVVGVGGVEKGRITHAVQAIQCVLAVDARGVAGGRIGTFVVGDRAVQTVQRIEALLALVAQRVDAGDQVAVGVVAVARAGTKDGMGQAVDHRGELTQRVELAGQVFHRSSGRGADLFTGLVAGCIQRVVKIVALRIGDVGQAMCAVVGKGGGDAVGIGDRLDGAVRPIGERRGGATDAARGKPAARRVG